MDAIAGFLSQFIGQLQSPTLAFLIGGALLAALGSKLTIPNSVYQFVVFVLLMKIGLKAGIEIRAANLVTVVEGFDNVKIEVVLADRAKAERIAERVLEECLTDNPGIMFLDMVEVCRTDRF